MSLSRNSSSRWIKRERDNCYKIEKISSLNSIKVLLVFFEVCCACMMCSVVKIVCQQKKSPNGRNLNLSGINFRRWLKSNKVREKKMIELTARKITDKYHLELLKVNPSWNREEHLNDFLNWLHTNHVDTSNFEVSSFNNYGMGLKATKDLPVGSSSMFRLFSIVINFSQINAFWWYHYQLSLQVKQSWILHR